MGDTASIEHGTPCRFRIKPTTEKVNNVCRMGRSHCADSDALTRLPSDLRCRFCARRGSHCMCKEVWGRWVGEWGWRWGGGYLTLKELGVWRMWIGAEPVAGPGIARGVVGSRGGSSVSASTSPLSIISSWIFLISFSSPLLYTSVPLTSTTNLQQ